jgi:glycosyltransferase involved in cell wall biosynthesis
MTHKYNTNSTHDRQICIFGPLPPPYGGIATHVAKSASLLSTCTDVTVFVRHLEGDTPTPYHVALRPRWRGLIPHLLAHYPRHSTILHFHDINWAERAAIGLLGLFGYKTILTLHGDSFLNQMRTLGRIPKTILISALKRMSRLVAVNEQIAQQLIDAGIDHTRISTIPSYIAQPNSQVHQTDIPEHVRKCLDAHTTTLCTCAARLERDTENKDLYGIDMCLNLISDLQSRNIHACLIACIPEIIDHSLYRDIQEQIEALGIGKHVCIVTQGDLFPSILQRSDLFVRPTTTDGYGISIAEAITLGIPAVASNVCERTPGCRCFPAGDREGFLHSVLQAMEEGIPPSEQQQDLAAGAHGLLRLYSQLMNTQSKQVHDGD